MAYTVAFMMQVIDGVPFPMNYNVAFSPALIPGQASTGTVSSNANGATLSGVYTYTPSTSSTASTMSFNLTCTKAGNGGNPSLNSSTNFCGNAGDPNWPIFIGSLRGIPPYQGNSFVSGNFALFFSYSATDVNDTINTIERIK